MAVYEPELTPSQKADRALSLKLEAEKFGRGMKQAMMAELPIIKALKGDPMQAHDFDDIGLCRQCGSLKGQTSEYCRGRIERALLDGTKVDNYQHVLRRDGDRLRAAKETSPKAIKLEDLPPEWIAAIKAAEQPKNLDALLEYTPMPKALLNNFEAAAPSPIFAAMTAMYRQFDDGDLAARFEPKE